MTVQGPVKEQQPDGMSHRGALARDSSETFEKSRLKSSAPPPPPPHGACSALKRALVRGTCLSNAKPVNLNTYFSAVLRFVPPA